MKRCIAATALSILTACATAAGLAFSESPMACDTGPASKNYGGTEWRVYSCKDERSVVVVAAPGNPATPFFFFLSPAADGVRVYGEGDGDKKATKPAFDALKAVTAPDLQKLIAETKHP